LHRILNSTATGTFDVPLDLANVAKHIKCTYYDPWSFSGLFFLSKPKVILFANGKFTVVGAKSYRQIRKTVEEIYDLLRTAGFVVPKPSFRVVNVAIEIDIKHKLDLEDLATIGKYEPEAGMPAVTIYHDKFVYLCFSSGKIICTGIPTFEQVPDAVRFITDLIGGESRE